MLQWKNNYFFPKSSNSGFNAQKTFFHPKEKFDGFLQQKLKNIITIFYVVPFVEETSF